MTTKTFFAAVPARANLAVSEDNEVFTTFTFNTPKVDTSSRPPLDIAVAMDVSGSMGGQKIEMAKKSLLKLVEHLTDRDRLSLVAFDTHVTTVFDPAFMDTTSKRGAIEAIKSLYPRSCTNLSGGTLQALSYLTVEPPPEGTIQRCMVFTDGHPNVGVSDPAELINVILEARMKRAVSTFGYGSDHNPDLLSGLAQEGDFHFIDNPDKILAAFGMELGGLISTYAQNVRLTLTPAEGVEIVEILNDLTVKDKDDGAVIEVDDLLADQEYSVAVKLKINARDTHGPRAVKMVAASVSYFDVGEKKQSTDEAVLKIRFVPKGKEDTEDDAAVMDQVLLQKAIQVQAQAIQLAEAGNYEGARGILISNSRDYASVGTKTSLELGEMFNALAEENYASHAAYHTSKGETRALRSAMSRKRGTTVTKGGVDYSNEAQFATSAAFTASDSLDSEAEVVFPKIKIGMGAGNVKAISKLDLYLGDEPEEKPTTSSVSKKRSDRW